MREDLKRVVETGYDRMAEGYLGSKDPEDPMTLAALEELTLPPGATVLDLGCGAGVPATRWLATHGFEVTGVDISARQLELARHHVPTASFIKADMTELYLPPESFDAVVAFQSIIHVPRAEHAALLERICCWLKPGGAFLATLAVGEWEGKEDDWEGWGAPMWWSHYDARANVKMLREAGFEVVSAEARAARGTGEQEETWLWVLARRPFERGVHQRCPSP